MKLILPCQELWQTYWTARSTLFSLPLRPKKEEQQEPVFNREIAVGEIFRFGDKTLKCRQILSEQRDICNKCALRSSSNCHNIFCTSGERKDRLDVYFVEFSEIPK